MPQPSPSLFRFASLTVATAFLLAGCVDEDAVDVDGDGVTTEDGDCDDTDATVNPGATELCDDVDQDCDGDPVNGLPTFAYWLDADIDAYGSGTVLTPCEDVPPGPDWVPVDLDFEDCDDTDPDTHPGADEVCDGADNDCDGELDEEFDGDGDGVNTCGADGVAGNADDDCDDGDPDNYPGNLEICDAEDNDCDELVDAADPSYASPDADGDGDAAPSCGGADCDDTDASLTSLDLDLDGVTSCDGDCNDENPTVRPGAPEVCDDADNDCNDVIDDGVGPDFDGDGFDTSGCGYLGSDCDDQDPFVFPDETYTSGYQRTCDPAVRPGFANSWAYARLNLPFYFFDPQTSTHYLYYRGHHDQANHQFGYSTSQDGVDWSSIQGPMFSEDPTEGTWDGSKISYPAVAYIPGKARPYVLAYHAQDDLGPERRIGIATAETASGDPADGTFKRMDMGGAAVSAAILDVSASPTAVDSERVLNPSLWFDEDTGVLHLWYTGRFGAPNQFAVAHAACDTNTSDCGSAADWVKTDSDGDGDPDIWLEGEDNGWDDDDAGQTNIIRHSDPDNYFGYELEIWYSSGIAGIGMVQGDIDSAPSWAKSAGNPVLTPTTSGRFDSESVTGRGVRHDPVTDEYHMYYGTSIELPHDATTGLVQSVLWGPNNYSAGASYIGYAVNKAPEIVLTGSSCTTLTGNVTDNAPDTVALQVYEDGAPVGGEFFGNALSNQETGVQSTNWTVALAGLASGTHDLAVVARDQGGAERHTEVTVTCP